jgi:asparagine synthase (glutamine-hydrolysing)
MCRIVGIWDFNRGSTAEMLNRMRDSLHHGGPDSADSYFSSHTQLMLGHRRLSIIDLSEAGRQPMHYGDFTVVFNGEIYNYQEIADALKSLGCAFKTGSDTEVLLQAFTVWGKDAVSKFRGMFAFALWDEKNRKLLLCRDRLGVKPLYWYFKDGLFIFASEIKAIQQHPKFDRTISAVGVSLYLQQGYIQAPFSIYENLHKLDPGSFLEIDENLQIKISKYWDAADVYKNTETAKGNEIELTDRLENLLKDSFRLRMVADVPVGMFLSGGIDSSTVAAILQSESQRKIKSFTIGFENKEYNEAQHAKAIAAHLGTEHHELYCSEKDFEEILELLPDIYDEPFGDSSGIPTYIVSRMAKNEVKVSLSADGGDELFGGYTKYEAVKNYYPKIKKLPYPLRKLAAGVSGAVNPLWLEKNAAQLPILKNYKNIANKFPKLRNALKAKDLSDFFNRSSTYISKEEQLKLFPYYAERFETEVLPQQDRLISYLGMIDLKTYLEGDIMTKVDRATMQLALEGREPMLDHKLVEFALSLPDDMKIRGNSTKYLLRQVLYRYIPKELMERPKQGFSIPIQQWLLGKLRPELEKMTLDKIFAERFGLNQQELQKIVRAFLAQKKFINPHFIWFLFVLYRWNQRWN